MSREAMNLLARVAPALPITLQDEVRAFFHRKGLADEQERGGLAWFCNWCLNWTRGRGSCSRCGQQGGLL